MGAAVVLQLGCQAGLIKRPGKAGVLLLLPIFPSFVREVS